MNKIGDLRVYEKGGSTITMRAVVYTSPREFTVRDIPVPGCEPGDVRVKVLQTGLCGTDLHLHDGQFMADFPFTPGHEVVGVVDAKADDVRELRVGQQVVVNPNSACGLCWACRAGRPLLCDQLSGIGSNRPGGFAEYLVAPSAQVFPADDLDPDTAVFTEPTSCVVHGLTVLEATPGSTALVLGAGPTGLLMAQLLSAGGVAQVTVAAPTVFKLKIAEDLGVDRTHVIERDVSPADITALLEATGGEGYDIVVDATGAAAVCQQTLALTRRGGTVMFYGVCDEDSQVCLAPYDIFRREITIKGSFAEIASFPPALTALRNRRVRTNGLITHRFSIDDYGAALEALRSDPTSHKIIVTP